MAETMCASWFHQFGVPTRIVRPFHTYGPGMALDDGRIFADFVANIIARQDLVIKEQWQGRFVHSVIWRTLSPGFCEFF